jgi:putative ATPase
MQVRLSPEALDLLVARSNGDARRALNALELGVLSTAPGPDGFITYDLSTAEESIQKKALVYDEDEHYDTISAFIKSMRGSDPDAAIYYLAAMLQGGEDPKFIARRLIVAASEDVGNADPRALEVAVAAARAVEFVGMPEARIPLAQATTYIALAPKSNASYRAVDAALELVEREGARRPPLALRDSSRRNARNLGHGTGYRYPHDFPDGVVDGSLMPDGLEGTRLFEATDRGPEGELAERLARLRAEAARRKE